MRRRPQRRAEGGGVPRGAAAAARHAGARGWRIRRGRGRRIQELLAHPQQGGLCSAGGISTTEHIDNLQEIMPLPHCQLPHAGIPMGVGVLSGVPSSTLSRMPSVKQAESRPIDRVHPALPGGGAHLGPGREDVPGRLRQLGQRALPRAAGRGRLELQASVRNSHVRHASSLRPAWLIQIIFWQWWGCEDALIYKQARSSLGLTILHHQEILCSCKRGPGRSCIPDM